MDFLDDLVFELNNLRPLSGRSLFTVKGAVKVTKDTAIVSQIFASLTDEKIDDYLEVLNKGIPYELRRLQTISMDYIQINSLFRGTLNPLKDRWKITHIDKVLCPYLLAAFLLMKQKKKKTLAVPTEMALYHGTSPSNVTSICKTNLNWRLRGTSRGHIFGQGVSFARRSTYACHYPSTSLSIKTLILAKVLVTKTTVGSAFVTIPPAGYDATSKANLDVIVKYDDAEYFPKFVIYYSN